MRIKTLTMSAFGPFKGVETIDFTEANNHRIFLISGPTGAGKTTIFDAISFALYGKASGSTRTDAEMTRSHFADRDVETYVELCFEVSNKTYMIRRSPRQERPRTRGDEGIIIRQHAAEFRDLGDSDHVLTRVSDVNAEIERILGISHDQFRQIVMLPQGEFQALLNASSDERTDIFRKIFNTYFFESFQNRLKDEADRLRGLIEAGKTRLETLFGQIICDPSSEIAEVLAGDEVSATHVILRLKEANDREEAKLDLIRNEQKKLIDDITRLKGFIDEMIRINTQISQREVLEEKRTVLAREQESIDSKRAVVANYDKALRIRPYEINAGHAQSVLIGLEKEHQQLINRIRSLNNEKANSQQEYVKIPALKERLSKLTQERMTIEVLLTHLMNRMAKRKTLSVLEKEEEKAVTELLELKTLAANGEETLEKTKNDIRQSEEERLDETTLFNQLTDARGSLEKLKRLHDGLVEHQRKTKELENMASAFQHDSASFKIRETTFRTLTESYFNTQAARLAQTLEAGMPCPVCGSRDHPAKASLVGTIIDEKTFKEQESEYQAALLEYNRKKTLLTHLQEDVMKRSKQELTDLAISSGYPGLPDLDALAIELESTTSTVAILEQARKKLENSQELLQTKKSTIKELENQVNQKRTEVGAKEYQLATIKGNIQGINDDMKTIDQAIGDDSLTLPEASSRKTRLTGEILTLEKTLKEIEDHHRDLQKALERENERKADLDMGIVNAQNQQIATARQFEEMTQGSFLSLEDYRKASLNGRDPEVSRAEVKVFDDQMKTLNARINQLDENISERQRENPQPHQDILETKEIQASEQNEAINRSSYRLLNNKNLLVKIREHYQAFVESEQAYLKTNELTMIARGMKGNKITFERYILAHYFTEILVAANQKLKAMTNNRYVLQRKSDRAKGAAQQGLDLSIFDAYTTKIRDVQTLSGGESFKAALSLALGLAEIIQRTSGGISLETMFIDEGFGTLDAQSLDIAVETLMEINQAGRVIGVISHVGELKNRIETKIEVETTTAGSHIR